MCTSIFFKYLSWTQKYQKLLIYFYHYFVIVVVVFNIRWRIKFSNYLSMTKLSLNFKFTISYKSLVTIHEGIILFLSLLWIISINCILIMTRNFITKRMQNFEYKIYWLTWKDSSLEPWQMNRRLQSITEKSNCCLVLIGKNKITYTVWTIRSSIHFQSLFLFFFK